MNGRGLDGGSALTVKLSKEILCPPVSYYDLAVTPGVNPVTTPDLVVRPDNRKVLTPPDGSRPLPVVSVWSYGCSGFHGPVPASTYNRT